ADDHALDFPIVFASGRGGWSTMDREAAKRASGQEALPEHPDADLRPGFDAIVKDVPPPEADASGPLQMLITTLDYNDYVGRIGIGRVFHGQIASGQQVAVMKMDGTVVRCKAQQLLRFQGLGRTETDVVTAGDICALVGLE